MESLVHLSPILESTSPSVLAFHPFEQLPFGVYGLEYGVKKLSWSFPEISTSSLSLFPSLLPFIHLLSLRR